MIDLGIWPAILVANAERFHLDARSRSGGETINGREQAVGSGLARWVATLTVPLNTPAKIRAMRSLLAKLDGRSNLIRVGPCDCRNGNRIVPPIGGIPYAPTGAFHAPTGAGFSIGGSSPYISEAASAGATQIKIFNGSTALPVLEGSFLGVGGYLYVVVGAEPGIGETTTLDIRPKLRAAVAMDDEVEWCHARAPMRLMADDSGAFELQLARMGTATIDLVEVW